jgi:hypothetical protein
VSSHGEIVYAFAVRALLCLAVLLVGAAPAAAQQPQPPAPARPAPAALRPPEFDDGTLTSFAFFAENDVLYQLGRNDDRNYTGGFGFQFSGSFIRKWHMDAPLRLVDRATRMSRAHDASPMRFYTFLFFGTGFTPDMLNTPAVVIDDRPYGSIVGFSLRRLTVDDETFDRAWSSELAVGMLGLDTAKDLQTWFHRRLRRKSGKDTPYDPLGWHHQISNGGEATGLYRVSYEQRIAGSPSGRDIRKHWQVVGGAQASAGYYTNAGLLTSARLGTFTSEFWEFTPGAMNVATQNLGVGNHRTSKSEIFLFAGLRPRVIAYNALLQGQFKHSDYTVTPKRLQAEWDLGVAAFIAPIRLQVVWNAYAGRSPEFVGALQRTHTWGSLVGVFSFPVKPR